MALNQAGQEFSGFRLLVEAVMVVLILSIILVTVTQIDAVRRVVSERRLLEGFDKAVRSPDGSVIFEKNLVLAPGSAYTRRTFSSRAIGMQPECVEIDAGESVAFSREGSQAIHITALVQTNAYYKCVTQYGEEHSDCRIQCTVSFGKELKSEPENSGA